MQPTQSAADSRAAFGAAYRYARACNTLRWLRQAASDASAFRGNGATAPRHLP